MTQAQIRNEIIKMGCLSWMEAHTLAGLIFAARETGAKEKMEVVAVVIDFLASAGRITLANRLDMLDLIY